MAAEDKRTAGQPFRPPPATMWNAMVEAGEQVQAGRFNQPGGSPRARKTDIIECKNLSGAARARGEVLGAFTNPFTNIERDNIKLGGAAPTAGGHVGVVLDPIASTKFGRVQLAGVCVAKVNISDADHEFAEIDPGEYVLVSAEEGQIGIVYAPSGTGVKDCVVRLGGGGGGGGGELSLFLYEMTGDWVLGQANADLSDMADNSLSINVVINDPLGIFSLTAVGDRGICAKQGQFYYVIQAACPLP